MNEKRAAEMFTPEELRAGLLSSCAIAGRMVEPEKKMSLAELAEALEHEDGTRDQDD